MKTFSEKAEDLGWHLEGTCASIPQALEQLEFDPEEGDWEDELLTKGFEECIVCAWWHRSGDLEWHDDLNGGVCQQCEENEEDDGC